MGQTDEKKTNSLLFEFDELLGYMNEVRRKVVIFLQKQHKPIKVPSLFHTIKHHVSLSTSVHVIVYKCMCMESLLVISTLLTQVYTV